MAAILGIDVSEHNGKLDWAKIKASGIRWAIIRTGYGKGYTDKQFVNNVKGCIANGIPFGVYHFSYALNVAGVKDEAAFVLSLLKPYKDNITLPVFYDFEYDTIDYAKKKGVTLGKQAFNDHTVAFCEAVKAAGYTPGTYYNLDYKNRFVDASRLSGYVQWYAQYASKATWTGYDIWQYSSKHRITGHSCNFDINILADASLLLQNKAGWKQNNIGWWYVHSDGTYTKDAWEQIDGVWYYFDSNGYMLHDTEVEIDGKTYKFDSNGHCTVKGESEVRYNKLKEITSEHYRPTVDKLIQKGLLQGKGGEGEDLVIDLSEDTVRTLVILDRAGVFGE